MWIKDSEYWTNEYEFNSFPQAVEFIENVAILAFNTELYSLWKQLTQIAKIKVKINNNSDDKELMKEIDNIYFHNK